ncbi:hypothetical protein HI850_007650 [bacterium SPL81]|nr:hypothetical protein [Acinetobacter baumannii]
MMPDNQLSTISTYADFFTPLRVDVLVDYELAGIDLYDTSEGMQVKLWSCFYEDSQIKIKKDRYQYTLLTVENVTALSFAFDLNMRPVVTYVIDGETHLWWYDSLTASQVTTNFGAEFKTPQLSLDEKRPRLAANADVIFAYIKEGRLCIRLQRDRYEVEYDLSAGQALIQIGMMKNNRFGFATKIINGFDLFLDQMYVDARNKVLRFDYLDLCPLQSSYSVQFGNNILKTDGLADDLLRSQFENIENIVVVNFNLNKTNFDYFMSFFRVWQHKRKPFYIDLVLDQRPLTQYLVHFVAESISMSKQGNIFKVSAQLHLMNNPIDQAEIKAIVESRNVRI